MKRKQFYFLCLLVVAGVLVVACKPEKKGPDDTGGVNPGPNVPNCECTNMTVTHAGDITKCSDKALVFAECVRTAGGVGTACPNHTYKFKCPTGVNSKNWGSAAPDQKTGFLSEATLSAGSVTGDCKFGEVLQLSITSGGQPEANPSINPTFGAGNQTIAGYDLRIDNSAAHQYPQIGARNNNRDYYGGDNYSDIAAADVLSGRDGDELFWWDNTDQGKDNKPEVAEWDYKYISFVQGTAGKSSCSCVFTINVDWDANQDPVTTYTKVAGQSQNCTF